MRRANFRKWVNEDTDDRPRFYGDGGDYRFVPVDGGGIGRDSRDRPDDLLGEEGGTGSGIVIDPSGYVLTNNHVVENASEVNVAFADGSTERGEVVGADPSTEIAVVRVDRDDLPAIELAGVAATLRHYAGWADKYVQVAGNGNPVQCINIDCR